MVLVQTNSTQSAKICPNLHFFDGRGSGCWSRPTKPTSAKICPNLHFQGGGLRPTQPKVPKSVQICIFEGGGDAKICPNLHFSGWGGGWWSRPTQPKVPRSVQICMGGVVQTNIPEILEWGHSRNFGPKFQPLELATASQIVYHTLVCED